MGPGLFWNFPSKTSCTVSQTLLQTMLLSKMAGMKEQQFIEEKPLLPETRGQETEMARGACVNAGPSPQPARPTRKWHEIARHWLGVTRRHRTSGGCIPVTNAQATPTSFNSRFEENELFRNKS
ncbi:protein NDRG4 isoform X1 [Tachysurus ichikawai]